MTVRYEGDQKGHFDRLKLRLRFKYYDMSDSIFLIEKPILNFNLSVRIESEMSLFVDYYLYFFDISTSNQLL